MSLSQKEYAVLGCIAAGLGDKEIALKLKMSIHTVRTHIKSIYGKMSAKSRSNAVAIYYEEFPKWKKGRRFKVR